MYLYVYYDVMFCYGENLLARKLQIAQFEDTLTNRKYSQDIQQSSPCKTLVTLGMIHGYLQVLTELNYFQNNR